MNAEDDAKPQRWYHELSIVRWIFAIFGILIMVFAGGCGAAFLTDYLGGRSGMYIDPFTIMMFAGPPFLVGLLLWWLAAKVGRQKSLDEEQ